MAKSPFDKVLLVEPPKDGEDVDAEPKPMTQVLWPRHCVQHEIGSMTHGDLITTESDIIVYKGTNPRVDSYSAFYDNARLGTPLTKDGRSLLHELRSKGVNRLGNLLVPNDNYCAFEQWAAPIVARMHDEQERSGTIWPPSAMIARFGREVADETSVLSIAWRRRRGFE